MTAFGKPVVSDTALENMRIGQKRRRDREARRKRILVDTRCFDLAAYFLSDLSGVSIYDATTLAEAIQVTCEDFIADLPKKELLDGE